MLPGSLIWIHCVCYRKVCLHRALLKQWWPSISLTWNRRVTSLHYSRILASMNKKSEPEGPGFGLPPEGASMVFPFLRQSAEVMEHCKISNSKHQITNKFQIPILNDQNSLEFWNWGPARRVGSPSEARTILVIVICLIFEICDLKFLFLQYSNQSPFS